MTSDAQARDLERARRAGATSVLVKPCLPDTLITEAIMIIGESRALRDRSAATRVKIPVQLGKGVLVGRFHR